MWAFTTLDILSIVYLFTVFRRDTHLGYYANSADPIQMPPNAASDQGLHCLQTEISMENTVKMKTKLGKDSSK